MIRWRAIGCHFSCSNPSERFPIPRCRDPEIGPERSAKVGRQSRSNQVSGRRLPKTGVFAKRGGDFCRNGMRVCQFGSSETGAELQKPANSGLFCALTGGTPDLGTAWLALQCRSHPSPPDFPAIREFNREFRDSGPSEANFVARNHCAAATSCEIPYTN